MWGSWRSCSLTEVEEAFRRCFYLPSKRKWNDIHDGCHCTAVRNVVYRRSVCFVLNGFFPPTSDVSYSFKTFSSFYVSPLRENFNFKRGGYGIVLCLVSLSLCLLSMICRPSYHSSSLSLTADRPFLGYILLQVSLFWSDRSLPVPCVHQWSFDHVRPFLQWTHLGSRWSSLADADYCICNVS